MWFSSKINKSKFIIYTLALVIMNNFAKADFFENITNIIQENQARLSYGVAVSDITNDGNYEFIVTGFGTDNLALSYQNGVIKNIINNETFSDTDHRAIGVVTCDIDQDG